MRLSLLVFGLYILVSSCNVGQYSGSTASKAQQKAMGEKVINYNEKQAEEIIEHTSKNKKKRKKKAEKERKKQNEYLKQLNDNSDEEEKRKVYKKPIKYKFY